MLGRRLYAFLAWLAVLLAAAQAEEKKKIRYEVEGEEWWCDEDGNCDDAPDKVMDQNVIEGSIIERRLTLEEYTPHCGVAPNDCYRASMLADLDAWQPGISKEEFEDAFEHDKHLVRYQIIDDVLYRTIGLNGTEEECLFPARCRGIEFMLLKMIGLYKLPRNLELAVNIKDYPLSKKTDPIPVFSFSKNSLYNDILYPAWSFYEGGPCIESRPDCIGKWAKEREVLTKKAEEYPWPKKLRMGFFRGSRTTPDRDALIQYSKKHPGDLDAKYTKNQAWRSIKDSGGEQPVPEVPIEDHCKYSYLFNARGVAASFRYRHLFMCGSVVLNVDPGEWQEFWYPALREYIHYIPIKKDMSDAESQIQWLRENGDLAKLTAENGFNFVRDNLKMIDIYNYWYDLLREYAKLLEWEVEKAPNARKIQLKPKKGASGADDAKPEGAKAEKDEL